jgi:hypothetical protein
MLWQLSLRLRGLLKKRKFQSCVCLLLQYLLQRCSRGGRGIVEDMCHKRRRTEACVH